MPGLDDRPFGWSATKDGRVRITYGPKVVTTVAGAAATRLRAALEAADADGEQQLLARATGNFKRGNERR